MSEIHITPKFLTVLREHGLDSFEAVMQCKVERVMRSVPGRSTGRLPMGIYLKRYEPEYYSMFRRWWHRDEAENEWTMLHALQRADFLVPKPIAFGRRGARSFVMTQEVAGVPADTMTSLELMARIAKLTRRFHDAGFIHKDLYLCHIFVAGEELYFIDLQRAVGPDQFAERWRVKDLAALAHSAARIGIPLEAFREYDGNESLWQRVAARVAWLDKRRPKYVGVWDDPESSKAKF